VQIAVRHDSLPEGIKLSGKRKLKPDTEGFILVDLDTILPALDATITTGEKSKDDKTFYSLAKDGEHDGNPAGRIVKVRVENVSYEKMSDYVKYFRRLAVRLKMDLEVHHSHESISAPIVEDEQRLHIFPFSSPGSKKKSMSFEFDGEDLDPLCVDFVAPAFMGKVYGDEAGMALVEWTGRNAHILWDFQHIYAPKAEEVLDKIFSGSLKELERTAVTNMKQVRERVADAVKGDHTKMLQEYEQLKQRVDQLERDYTHSVTEMDAMARIVGDPEKAIQNRIDQVIKDIEDLYNLRSIMNVTYDGKKLEVTTTPIYTQGRNLGRWVIKVANGAVRIRGLDKHSQHPHISGDNPCFGDISNAVSKMVGRKEYMALISFLIDYLRTSNETDHYTPIQELGIPMKKGEEKRLKDGVVQLDEIEGFDPANSLLFEDAVIEGVKEEKAEEPPATEGKKKAKKGKGK
jgi:hypothetical protein